MQGIIEQLIECAGCPTVGLQWLFCELSRRDYLVVGK